MEVHTTGNSGRLKAFLTHLTVSACVVAATGAVFWFVFYPVPLFRAVGALNVFLMLIAVDVVLGPCLTLLVYRKGKAGLIFDLAVIALIQAAALTYGVTTLYLGRPVYVAAVGHRFDVIQANDVRAQDLAEAGGELPRWGPRWVGIRQPEDAKERSEMIFSALGGVDYGHKPKYHVPIENSRSTLLSEAKPITALRANNPVAGQAITDWLRRHNASDEAVRYLGLKAKGEDMAVILDAKTGEIVGVAPFRPWK